MRDLKDIWRKQFGFGNTTVTDFTGEVIKWQDYKKVSSPYSWDVYELQNDEYIIVNLLTFNLMPKDWKNNFIVNGNEYKITKKSDGKFDVLLLLENKFEEEHDDLYYSKRIANTSTTKIIKPHEPKKTNNYTQQSKNIKFETLNKSLEESNIIESDRIWESVYGERIIAYDFLGVPILKSEYKTDTNNSWDSEPYERGNNQLLIASIDSLKLRAKRNNFIFDNVEYSVINENGKLRMTNSKEKNKILFSDNMMNMQIEKYFPSFLLNKKHDTSISPYYSSLVINLAFFPLNELEKLRTMLKIILRESDIFEDIFIYSSENSEITHRYGNNCYIRIFFKSNNTRIEDMEIFETSFKIKHILSMAFMNIKTLFNMSDLTSFTMYLTNHNKSYKFLSWFTNGIIEKTEVRPIRVNKGEFLIDQYYYDLFNVTNGREKSFKILKTLTDETFYLCNLNYDYMEEDIKNRK